MLCQKQRLVALIEKELLKGKKKSHVICTLYNKLPNFPVRPYHFISRLAIHETCSFSTFLPVFGTATFFFFSFSCCNRYVVMSH